MCAKLLVLGACWGGDEIKFSPTAEIGLYGCTCMPRRLLWIPIGTLEVVSGVTHGPPNGPSIATMVPLELCQSKLEKGHRLEISTPGPSSWDFMVRLTVAFFVLNYYVQFFSLSSTLVIALHLSPSRRA